MGFYVVWGPIQTSCQSSPGFLPETNPRSSKAGGPTPHQLHRGQQSQGGPGKQSVLPPDGILTLDLTLRSICVLVWGTGPHLPLCFSGRSPGLNFGSGIVPVRQSGPAGKTAAKAKAPPPNPRGPARPPLGATPSLLQVPPRWALRRWAEAGAASAAAGRGRRVINNPRAAVQTVTRDVLGECGGGRQHFCPQPHCARLDPSWSACLLKPPFYPFLHQSINHLLSARCGVTPGRDYAEKGLWEERCRGRVRAQV